MASLSWTVNIVHPHQGRTASTPLTMLLTCPSVTARTATMEVKPKPSKVQGSTAKKRVPASRVSKKAFHKPKSRESFVFTKAPLMSPLTLQEPPRRQLGHSIFHQWLPSISNWKEGLSTRHGLTNLQKVKTISWWHKCHKLSLLAGLWQLLRGHGS